MRMKSKYYEKKVDVSRIVEITRIKFKYEKKVKITRIKLKYEKKVEI